MSGRLTEIKAAREKVAANKTGWVEIKPEWFASREDLVAYLVERKAKRRLEILDARIAALEESRDDG